jgi:hypothetical protein
VAEHHDAALAEIKGIMHPAREAAAKPWEAWPDCSQRQLYLSPPFLVPACARALASHPSAPFPRLSVDCKGICNEPANNGIVRMKLPSVQEALNGQWPKSWEVTGDHQYEEMPWP